MSAESIALDRVLELAVVLNDDMTSSLARAGLTVARAHLLWELRRRGPMTQQALAAAMAVSPRNVTGLVDGLVGSGFVTREPHPTDRRATLVTCTERGSQTAEMLASGQQELAQTLFASMAEPDLRCFTAGLDHVLRLLRDATGDLR